MRAISAFLNGAGSRRNLKVGRTDRTRLMLTDLLVTAEFPGEPIRARAATRGERDRGPARRAQRLPR